jgi:hypothetical protein
MHILYFLAILGSLIVAPVANSATFKIQEISKALEGKIKHFKTWKEGCPLSIDRLKLVEFSYYDFDGKEQHGGQIIVMDAVANRVLNIFKELHTIKFPIAKARPIEYYEGNDEISMSDNNTNSFNCREITGGGLFSIHSYGLAIDINPIQNPYVSFNQKENCSAKILPPAAKDYINRISLRPGMVESISEIFKKNGFYVWGGEWNSPIDWQHFQTPRPVAQLLAAMSYEDALEFFEIYVTASEHNMFEPVKEPNNGLLDLYKQSPKKFMDIFRKHRDIFSFSSSKAYNFIATKVKE